MGGRDDRLAYCVVDVLRQGLLSLSVALKVSVMHCARVEHFMFSVTATFDGVVSFRDLPFVTLVVEATSVQGCWGFLGSLLLLARTTLRRVDSFGV
jgi:hypothetical protein